MGTSHANRDRLTSRSSILVDGLDHWAFDEAETARTARLLVVGNNVSRRYFAELQVSFLSSLLVPQLDVRNINVHSL